MRQLCYNQIKYALVSFSPLSGFRQIYQLASTPSGTPSVTPNVLRNGHLRKKTFVMICLPCNLRFPPSTMHHRLKSLACGLLGCFVPLAHHFFWTLGHCWIVCLSVWLLRVGLRFWSCLVVQRWHFTLARFALFGVFFFISYHYCVSGVCLFVCL